MFVGGTFTIIGGAARSRLAKLSASATGIADPVWNASTNGAVSVLSIDAAGDVYAGGSFTTLGGALRSNLAKVSGQGAGPVVDNWNPSANGAVRAFASGTANSLLVGGLFGQIGNGPRDLIAALPTFESSLFAAGFEDP